MSNDSGHDWHLFDELNGIWCRKLVGDVLQLKNDTHFVTLNQDEFNTYLEDPEFEFLLKEFSKWDRATPL